MKRSEAIKLITDIISEVTYENLAEKRAEKILSNLEDKGILPPIDTTNDFFARTIEVSDHRWESENE